MQNNILNQLEAEETFIATLNLHARQRRNDLRRKAVTRIVAEYDRKLAEKGILPGEPAPLYDFDRRFVNRQRLDEDERNRLEMAAAKLNWTGENGKPGYFNRIKESVPVESELAIYSHIHNYWTCRLIECGLFYTRFGGAGCERLCECRRCSYTRVISLLNEAYQPETFQAGGHWYAITYAPRQLAEQARAVGRALETPDWIRGPDSVVFRESFCPIRFIYPRWTDCEPHEWDLERTMRRFLAAGQGALRRMVHERWLDGVRRRDEFALKFVPFGVHPHAHATACSTVHDCPQGLADEIKQRMDEVLQGWAWADVLVAKINSFYDLRRWLAYTEKTIDIAGPVKEAYEQREQDLNAFEDALDWDLRLMRDRLDQIYDCRRIEYEPGDGTYHLTRRSVHGCLQFGNGTILSEPAWHRKRRERINRKKRESRQRRSSHRRNKRARRTGGNAGPARANRRRRKITRGSS
jgi:hypothetical protein